VKYVRVENIENKCNRIPLWVLSKETNIPVLIRKSEKHNSFEH